MRLLKPFETRSLGWWRPVALRSVYLLLVCALAGTGPVLAAYRHAVAQRYRFFSYGDAMFVTRAEGSGGS